MGPTDPDGNFPLGQPSLTASLNEPLDDIVIDILQFSGVSPFRTAGFGLGALSHTPSLGVF